MKEFITLFLLGLICVGCGESKAKQENQQRLENKIESIAVEITTHHQNIKELGKSLRLWNKFESDLKQQALELHEDSSALIKLEKEREEIIKKRIKTNSEIEKLNSHIAEDSARYIELDSLINLLN